MVDDNQTQFRQPVLKDGFRFASYTVTNADGQRGARVTDTEGRHWRCYDVSVFDDSSPALKQRLKDFEAATKLEHPCLLSSRVVHHEDRSFWLTERLESAVSLTDRVRNRWDKELQKQRLEHLSPEEFLPVLDQLCQIFELAQNAGLRPREVDSEFCFVSEAGQLELRYPSEFVSIEARAEAEANQVGFLIGRPRFQSPEFWRGECTDIRSDIYGLGCLTHWALTARSIINGKSLVDLGKKIATLDFVMQEDLSPRLPTGLSLLIKRCLQKKAEDRFQSYSELRQAIAACMVADPLAAPKRSLLDQIEEQQGMGCDEVLELGFKLLLLLRDKHDKGKVYGAIRPELIELRDGELSIRELPKAERQTRWLAQHTAPELCTGTTFASVKGDLYSVGSIMAFALLASPMFAGDTLKEVVLNKKPMVRMMEIQKLCQKPVWQFIAKLIQGHPRHRFKSATEALVELKWARAELKTLAEQSPPATKAPRQRAAAGGLFARIPLISNIFGSSD